MSGGHRGTSIYECWLARWNQCIRQ